MANAPLSEQDGDRYRAICDFGKAEYFFRQGLTRWLQNSLTGKSVERIRARAMHTAATRRAL
jgi:hypothetical protein